MQNYIKTLRTIAELYETDRKWMKQVTRSELLRTVVDDLEDVIRNNAVVPDGMVSGKTPLCEVGLYEIHWKTGGKSVASVYCDANGDLIIAPANWVGPASLNGVMEGISQYRKIVV